jgi:valyl-tRNA synthetase
MKDMAKRAADEVRNGKTNFVPKRYEKQYFNWLDNIQDWCISRQLWWGHRIPAYYCKDCGHINVSKVAPKKCEKCGSTVLEQDPDTLDTWFSSALWPFSTLGWPNKELEDYKMFYPTNTLVTGFDIITFWVSRMMSQGLELTGEAPFKDVLIHGIVRDSQGRKMSKTLGNGIDPLDIVEKYGADSLRFSVLSGTTMGNDIRFMPEKLDQASNFANKIWNAAKFIINSLADEEKVREFCYEVFEKEHKYNESLLRIEDKWILNKFDKLVVDITKNIDNYDLGIALDNIYNFIWNEFCDWYIEMVKPRIYSTDESVRVQVSDILNHVFGSSLKLLHPFMPFITSEIYSKLICFGTKDLMVSKWPDIRKEFVFDEEEATVEKLKKLIVEIRNVRAKMNVHPSKKAKLILVTDTDFSELEEAKEFLCKLGFSSEVVIQKEETEIPENAVSIVVDNIKAFIPFEDLVDIAEEIERLKGEKKKLELEVERGEKMLSNPGFVNKAPEKKVNEEKEKLANYKQMLESILDRLSKFEK